MRDRRSQRFVFARMGFLRRMVPLTVKRRLKLALRVLVNGPAAPAAHASPGEVSPPADPAVTACPLDTILACAACPVCGHPDRTLVCEYNKFVLFEHPPDADAPRYNYSLCDGCGVLYAASRPGGARYRWLFEHFEATIGRTVSSRRSVRQLTISSFALTEDDRAELRKAIDHGVFVSEHLPVSRKEYIPGLLSDRLSGASHVELLGSLLELRSRRVLEIRTRTASISAALGRLYGARAHAMALFENQRFVIEEVYGIPTSPIDYEDFQIPDIGPFDLVIANHMLTHAVRPAAFLAAVRRVLSPGGHLYVYSEPDDAEYLADGKSMFNSLNAFHLQAFDGPSLTRALAANGFETVFLTRHEGALLSLSRACPAGTVMTAMDPRERDRRVRAHLDARDAAVLMLPPGVRPRFADEWEAVVERAFASGIARIDGDGRVHFRKRPTASSSLESHS